MDGNNHDEIVVGQQQPSQVGGHSVRSRGSSRAACLRGLQVLPRQLPGRALQPQPPRQLVRQVGFRQEQQRHLAYPQRLRRERAAMVHQVHAQCRRAD